ncbi:MAG: glycoside hydrolase family 3 N-terminal domain-containing protein, partial [Bacteroidota bacterium]
MKVLRAILYIFLSLAVILLIAFFVLKRNPKPELITLDRVELKESQIEQQAKDLVAQMSLEEKVQMMSPVLQSNLKVVLETIGNGMRYNQESYQAGGNERLQIPTMRFFDGPRGMVSGEATCFPVAMARAATFSPDLESRIGEAIGKEIRANQGNYFGGVCINLLRHPAGGRAQEAYGEDSFLLGQMGSSLMKGVQKHNVMACIKHYALNNQENARFYIDVEADERVLREVYLPHFKACIDNGAASVMGAYNKFRGEHLCHNSYMLRTILKEEWGFQGFTISDFLWGIHDTEKAANAGLDIEMPAVEDYGSHLVEAVKAGKVAEDLIDDSALRVARTVLKFETRPDPIDAYPTSLIGNTAHIDLALEAAEKSMVLMQNEADVLPLDVDKVKNVLVVGKLAVTENVGDHGSSRVIPAYVTTPMEGLEQQYGDQITFTHDTGESIENTKTLAQEADAVIFVVGYDHDDEGEFIELPGLGAIGGDRASLKLHEEDRQLLQTLGALNENSVAVLIGGSAILVEEWKDEIKAIIHAFYPGMEGGTAIAKTIFGAINPG